ncbi:MAG: hypothetical protein PHF24_04960 [Syntrophomonas sp.]|nr:hypothetical protein [Syntrophomonas sp.]
MNIICAKCGVTNNVENDSYCQNCSTLLENYCTNLNCILNDGEYPETCGPANCICIWCGCETTHYVSGILKPQKIDNDEMEL